jgi:hypothetical protein
MHRNKLGEAIYEASSRRVAECDHLVGTERQMLARCIGKLGWGEVNFLLTTPKSRPRWRLDLTENEHTYSC